MPPTQSLSTTDVSLDVATIGGRDADRIVVWLSGEHDIATEGALRGVLAEAIALDNTDLVVDLSAVQFMGASTVGVLVRARRRLRRQSRDLVLRSPSGCARRVLDLCGLADWIEPCAGGDAGMAGTGSALGTWVAVAATSRVDRLAEGAAPTQRGTTSPVRVGRKARKGLSVDVGDPAESRLTTVASRGGL